MLRWLGILGGVALVIGLCGRFLLSPAAKAPAYPAENPGVVDERLLDAALALEAGQQHLAQTVWAAETLAQKYEETFIRLWDGLKSRPGDFSLALDLLPAEIVFPEFASTGSTIAYGIELLPPSSALRTLGAPEWQAMLKGWQQQGYTLEQSEWRHIQFDPPTGNVPARSVMEISLHALHAQRNERYLMRGNLVVTWPVGEFVPGEVLPARVQVKPFTLLKRTGATPFRAVLNETVMPEAKTHFIDPLLVQDLDGDGLSEIVLAAKNRVYWNRGQFRFEAAPLCAHTPPLLFTAVFAEVTGDGVLDYLCIDREGLLRYRGAVNGRFTEAPERVWTAPDKIRYGQALTVGDVDGDGDNDLWLGQYKVPYTRGQLPTPYHDADDGYPAYLLINDGAGKFSYGTADAGLENKRHRRIYSGSLVDTDGDGDLDLLAVSDFAGADLWVNNGRGKFSDGVNRFKTATQGFGMAHALADLNGDGHIDFFMVGMNSPAAARLDHLKLGHAEFPAITQWRAAMTYGNRTYLSDKDGFHAAPFSDQLARSGWAWGASFLDWDNDGQLDLYVANGHESLASVRDYEPQFWCHDVYVGTSQEQPVHDLLFKLTQNRLRGSGMSYGGYEKNRFYQQTAAGQFLETGYLMGVSLEADSRSVVSDDLDGDGRMDLLVTTYESWPKPRQTLQIYRNELATTNNWIALQLRPSNPQHSAIGARVRVVTPENSQTHWIVAGDSYRAQHAASAHFGLGQVAQISYLEVRWPNGDVQRLETPAINQMHILR